MIPTLDIESDGAAAYPALLDDAALEAMDTLIEEFDSPRAGVRLSHLGTASYLFSSDGLVGGVASAALGAAAFPVRAIFFDKSARSNWALGWHQDRTIAVARHVEVPNFDIWSVKQGLPHVEPPLTVLEQMVTVRLHLDDVDDENAPLLVARGSHRAGRVAASEAEVVARRYETIVCRALRGDVWLYSTLILHSSERATRPRRRRVLQVDFTTHALPGKLDWIEMIRPPALENASPLA